MDPITKEPLKKSVLPVKTILIGGTAPKRIQKYEYASTIEDNNDSVDDKPNKFVGTSDTYINLLEPYVERSGSISSSDSSVQETLTKLVVPFLPSPLRTIIQGNENTNEYIPMRDLFTNPYVSYLYERGWRQGFGQAGFPGVDTEAIMALDYFTPSLIDSNSMGIVVDMSCATGLFTRKFIERAYSSSSTNTTKSSSQYVRYPRIQRVIGADYSDSMLREARRRIDTDPTLQNLIKSSTENVTVELVRLDVGSIPMLDNSVDALHAGAAMHCWPELPKALNEIYRVLRPNGGRYFATTFLSSYFRNLQRTDISGAPSSSSFTPSQQTFQYFQSAQELRNLLENAGFASNQIQIEVVGTSCVIIRCEK
jgi:ubiquinone/menaquinone biosynthesis C-methylase UbiE